jgi:predicted NBD/HSP70 family sugar kinase
MKKCLSILDGSVYKFGCSRADSKKHMHAPVHTKPKRMQQGVYPKYAERQLALLRLIHANNYVSRADLVDLTGFSAGSITGLVQDLISKCLVTELPEPARISSSGRRPIALNIRHDAAYAIGVDLGSFYLRALVTDMLGNIVYKLQIETNLQAGRQQVVNRMVEAIRTVKRQCGIPQRLIRSIGVGHSGIIDSATGTVLSFPRPGQTAEWKSVPLRKMLEAEFSMPCILEDSVRAIALAERCFGAGKNLEDFIYIDVGMGIGAAIIFKGALYEGSGGGAGEFGHMTVEENGRLCCCGNIGCLEIMSSCAAIIRTARNAIEHGVDSKIRDLVRGDLDQLSIEVIAQAAQNNDSLAFRVLDEAMSHIGIALADMVNLLNPGVVIFGGPLFRAAPHLIEALKRVIKQRALERSANQVLLRVSNLGSEAGALGAARAASEKVLERLYNECI